MTDRALELEPGVVREALATKRFLAQDRVKVGIEEIATWDRFLLRETRLLVPVDLQALFVPEGDTEPMVRLPMATRETWVSVRLASRCSWCLPFLWNIVIGCPSTASGSKPGNTVRKSSRCSRISRSTAGLR